MVVSAKKFTLGAQQSPGAYRVPKPSTRQRITLPQVHFLGERKLTPRPAAQKLSSRAAMVLSFIEAKPGFTALEYSDLVTEPTDFINAVLLNTTHGSWLISNGMVAVTTIGGLPSWYKRLSHEERTIVPIRDPEAQLKLPQPPKGVKGESRKDWNTFGNDVVTYICRPTNSPHKRLERLAKITAHMKVGMKREIEAQKTIAQLQLAPLATAPVPMPQAALPAPQPKISTKGRARKAPEAKVTIATSATKKAVAKKIAVIKKVAKTKTKVAAKAPVKKPTAKKKAA